MDPVEELLQAARESRIASYNWVSGLAFLTCDTISTFPREVTFIWSAKWSIPKVLYLFMRYWTLFELVVAALTYSSVQQSLEKCKLFLWYSVSVGGSTILLVVIDIILGIRLYALYERSSIVLILLVLLVLGETGVQTYVSYTIGRSAVKSVFLAPPQVPLLGCLTRPDLRPALISWILTPTVSAIYFLLMAVKFCQSIMNRRRSGARVKLPPVLRTFFQDGTFYFLLIVVTLVAGGLDALLVTGPYVSLYMPWNAAAFAITGTRLILHLREAAVADGSSIGTEDPLFRTLEPSLAFADDPPIP